MGGKHKQAQRIKNNARPSSSGRSAELLASSSSLPQFSAMKEIRFIPPTLSLLKTDEFDSSVSPDFQIVFKKMNKKDSTTKLKALQEFADLVTSADAEAVKAVLAFWATLYNFLATDTDHRIREAVHNAHYQIVLKDKKSIAPYLKQLIGPWFTSQYDNYPPAASAASKAFTAAFPPGKVQDCVVFCQKEVLTYIFNNVTSRIDPNPKHGTNEDAEAKYERIIISSLQGYCLYLNTLTEEQILKCDDLNKSIITNGKFLKLSQHKAPMIRAMWFKTIATLYHKAPQLLDGQHGALVAGVFGDLDESEPAVVGSVWEAAVLIMDFGQEWWQHINVEKVYLAKLRKVLREGGQGSAAVIYPNLLSFLHKLPPVVQQLDHFYDTFFDNLRIGMKRRSVMASKSESTAIITATVECLQFVLFSNQSNRELGVKLIKSQLIPLIDWCFWEAQASYRIVFNQVALLIQYWCRNRHFQNYSDFIATFWMEITTLFEQIVEKFNESNIEDVANRQIVMVQCFKNTKPKELLKVKFSAANEDDNNDNTSAPATTDGRKVDGQSYVKELIDLVYAMLKDYVKFIKEKQCKILQQHIFSAVQLFETRDFLIGLSHHIDGCENLIGIYENVLCDWLKSPQLNSEVVVDLAFVLFKYLDAKDKNAILTSFLELEETQCFCWCLKNAFSHPHSQDGIVQQWLRHGKVADFLVGITEDNLKLDCPTNVRTLFKLAFTENQQGELLIAPETVVRIIEKLRMPLLNPTEHALNIDSCARLASFVSEIIYTEQFLLKYSDDLLLVLISFSTRNHSDIETLTSDTVWEVNTSWQDAVSILCQHLSKNEFSELIEKFARIIEKTFLDNFRDDSQIQRLIEIIVNLIKGIFVHQPLIVGDVFDQLFHRDFVPICQQVVNLISTSAQYLKGKRIGDKFNEFQINDDDVMKYYVWEFMKSSVLASPVEDVDEDEEDEEFYIIMDIVEDNAAIMTDLLYDLTTVKVFLENYAMTRDFMDISHYGVKIKDKVKYMMNKLNLVDDIKKILLGNLSKEPNLWADVVFLYHNEVAPELPLVEVYKDYVTRLPQDSSYLHLTQVFGKFINFDCVQFTGKVQDDVIILRSLLHCDEIDVQIAEVFTKIKQFQVEDIPTFFLQKYNVDWEKTETVIEVIRLLTELVEVKFEYLNRQHWDFTVISLTSWTTNCLKWKTQHDNKQVQAFITATCDLYIAFNRKMMKLKMENVKNQNVEEWEDLFVDPIETDLLQLWLYFDENFSNQSEFPLHFQPFLQEFGKITSNFHWKYIFEGQIGLLPSWSKIFKRCCQLIVNNSPILQLWGYKMMLAMVPGLIHIDVQADSSTAPNTKGLTLEKLKEVLEQTNNIVCDILANFRLGEDSCQMKPFTDSYTYVVGYLLVWCVLLKICSESPPEVRYQYAHWIKTENYLKILLNNTFKLMPAEVLHCNEGKTKAFLQLFQKEPGFSFKDSCTSEGVEHLVCWVYALTLSQLPALVRQWWSETEGKVTHIVEKVTALYVSPQLCNQELLDVTQRESTFKNMTIKVAQSVREVVAIYNVDEAQIELVITLPVNYPLHGPEVRCNHKIGGHLHNQWMMQLIKCLLHQNGRIWDGLSLWNCNLDKKFDGVEECYICFAILHPGTYQLPKLSCQTCKKKFHSACLYKWFSTSNKSSCPICRNLF